MLCHGDLFFIARTNMKFTEATRVQIPAMVHLTRLGYTYFGKITEDKAGSVYDPDTNILTEIFRSQFEKLNPHNPGAWVETLRDMVCRGDRPVKLLQAPPLDSTPNVRTMRS
jgi:hypothetical protein